MDERADVQLTYKGPALKEGRMRVEDFCQSILGFTGAIQEISKALDPHSSPPVVKVGAITTSGKEDFTINLSIEADHKDTTEPQRKFVKQKCERCNMYALPGFNRCKYHTDPMSPTENIVTT